MGDVSLAHLFGRLAISMVVVLGLLALAARVMRRRSGMGASSGASRRTTRTQIEVVARQQLTRGSALAVVRTGDRVLVLGVTDTSITLLRDAAAGDAPADPNGPNGPSNPNSPTESGSDSPLDARSPRTAISGPDRRNPPWMSAVTTLRERTVRRH